MWPLSGELKIPDLNKYDKIMILDEGCIIEYDTPYTIYY